MDAPADADALVLSTEWKTFWSRDFGRIEAALRSSMIFDARNIYAPFEMEDAEIAYYGIGRGPSVATPESG